MWKNYSVYYLKNNRASSASIMAAAFIAALFLSLLCNLFYNFWLDNIEGTKLEQGDWQGRITGEISKEDIKMLGGAVNVEKAVMNEELSEAGSQTVDLYFHHKRTIYQDMRTLTQMLGLEEEAADYNYQLLSLYFVRIPGDNMPRMLMPVYLMIIGIVCVSLILIIHNSFALTMNSRVRQFGIFASIGATPGQIRLCLVQEALALAALPVLAGILIGMLMSFGILRAMSHMTAKLAGGREVVFHMHPLVFATVFLMAMITVLVSAWIPARKLSRLTPLEAIRGTKELGLTKGKTIVRIKKHSPVLMRLFGMEGELAGNALRAQKRALRTTSWSLTMAFLGFMLMQCFFTLSGISTDHTYFEAYQDAWDIMVTVKDTGIEDFTLAEKLRGLWGVDDSVVYQRAEAVCNLPREMQSRELSELGGLEAFAEDAEFSGGADEKGDLKVIAPIMILDDESYREFCHQTGVASRLDGTIILNQFWDSTHSNFRYPEYLPYVKEELQTIRLMNAKGGEEAVEISVIAYAKEAPLLREEYSKGDYPLVQIISQSLWKEIRGRIGETEKDTFIRILAQDRNSLASLNRLEAEVMKAVETEYEGESENRIQEKITNDQMIRGYEMVLGMFCALLAIIGIAHVFSNTLGFVHQRKQEFARYLSVGLTPGGIWKLFSIEALVVVGRPLAVTFLLTMVSVAIMIKASYLEPMEFIRKAPAGPILGFTFLVFGSVALAYYLGGRRILKMNLAQALRNEN